MNKILMVLGLTTLSCMSQVLSAQAQTADTNLASEFSEQVDLEKSSDSLEVEVVKLEDNFSPEPVPGTVATSTKALFSPSEKESSVDNADNSVAQRDIYLGRLNRHDYGYIGGGANLGFDGSSPLGDIGFALNAKVAFTNNISLRPAVIFSSETAFLIPVTYDFTLTGKDPFDPLPIVPFAGGGAILTTQDKNSAGFLLTGGLDYRISRDFVANASLNLGFLGDGTDASLFLGVGYILSGK